MTDDDFNNLKSVISDVINMKYYPQPYDDSGVRRWLDWCKNLYKENLGLWAVIRREDGQFLGDCGITWQNINGRTVPEIGYHLGLKYHGNGYITEAARAVRDYGFENFGFDELFSYMDSENIPSKCVAVRNSMNYRFRYVSNGEKLSVFSITREEWEGLKNIPAKEPTIYRKIIVVGPPGAGKSYISGKLAEKMGVKPNYLDVAFWKENWTPTEDGEFLEMQRCMMSEDRWIIDGTYVTTMSERINKCDTIILLDVPVEECLKNEANRRGKPRADLPGYLKETYDPEFIQYIKDYPDVQMKLIKAYISVHPEKHLVTLHSSVEINDFINGFKG